MSFSAPKPAPLPRVPTIDKQQQAAEQERRRLQNANGYSSTIATSPIGVTGPGPLKTSSLLGMAGTGA